MKILALIATLAMTGCATCERHPTFCAVGAAVVVGSVAATIAMHNDHHGDNGGAPARSTINAPSCANGSCQ